MNKLIIPFMFIVYLFTTACSKDDEPLAFNNIVGSWTKQYPEGVQTEGFIEWTFFNTGELNIRVYDVFAGDSSTEYEYDLSEENKSITISGNITNSEGELVHDKFAVYDIIKLTKKELRIKQSWVNTTYDNLEPENKNSFLLGGYKDVIFKKIKPLPSK